KDLIQTFLISIIGVVIIFFAFLLDDYVSTYKNYYFSFTILFSLHFTLTYIPRFVITSITVHKVHTGKLTYPTLLIVSDEQKALQVAQEIKKQAISSGMAFEGYLSLDGQKKESLEQNNITFLGDTLHIEKIIEKHNIEKVIIVLNKKDENEIYNIIFSIQKPNIEIYIPSDRKDLLTGNIRLQAIFSVPLVRIPQEQMEPWEFSMKRIFDILASLLAMIILSPVYITVAITVKLTSKGPIFYKQERIGKNGKPFNMYKFRSMYTDAEKHGPQLSLGDDDPRITPFGRFMRKVRLDEIPQFAHVFCGKMSMVGPRPERQFFIDKIVLQAPEYKLLQKIKPGMTSWGQVKFGYAETVDEMVERLKYDLLYLENMSMITDIKILLYTFIIIIEGRGK
ncbi:MAG: sugar transferase, partial [Bacteroidota bacterium]|nr:sugar transferase [Bacteroidota bacterium]